MPRRPEPSDYWQKGDTLPMTPTAVVLLSGGLDSTTLAYQLRAQGYAIHALSFDYGQRHLKELAVAKVIADDLGAQHHTIALLAASRTHPEAYDPLASILGSSSLTSDTPVPEGHYAAESMRSTVVPNRNAIMLSIAYGVAVGEGAQVVAFAAHAGDHAIYPDCRPEFVDELDEALRLGNAWDDSTQTPVILAPFLDDTKGEIALKAHLLDVPIASTWSCYKGGDVHCGTCGTCYERREALEWARGMTDKPDPTTYLDSTTTFEEPR